MNLSFPADFFGGRGIGFDLRPVSSMKMALSTSMVFLTMDFDFSGFGLLDSGGGAPADLVV